MVAFATQVKRRRGTEEQNDAFTGAEGEIVVDMTNMTLRVHDGRTRGGFVVGGGAGRNIGDIFFTTRTDTSLNGAVEANGGQYNTTDFAGSDSIGNMLSAGNVPYVTIAQFDSTVANNGFCSSFGWDGGTVFKVPKIPSKIMTKDQLAVVGNGMTLGLTNGTSKGGLIAASSQSYNLRVGVEDYGNSISTTNTTSSFAGGILGVTTDPEKSGIIATVDTVELRPMVQLANGATDEAVVVAGNVLADVSDLKSDFDALDVVIDSQLPTAENGYTWYRKYKSGWIEQGGYSAGQFSNTTFSYPVAMADTGYTLTLSVGYGNISTQHGKFGVTSRSETGFSYRVISLDNNAVGANMSWYVAGMAA